MRNIWLIAKREYLERIRTKAFIIMTVLIPVLMGGLVFGGGYLAFSTRSTSHVAVVAADAAFADGVKRELEDGKGAHMRVDTPPPTPQTEAALNAALRDNENDLVGYLWVTPPAAAEARPVFRYKPRSAGDIATEQNLKDAIKVVLTRERLTRQGMSLAEIDALLLPVDVDTSATGSSKTAFGAAYLLFFLMYMVIMLYGMNTARSIIEEKTSRVFEVMLSTITPDQMLAGKLFGVGAVGLTQIGIWMTAAGLLSYTPFAAALGGGVHLLITPVQIFFFVAYFIFAFLLYSSIAVALGAMTNSEQELQQLNMFLVMPLAFCVVMIFSIINAPDSTLAKVVSLIPFCSPLLMNFRISLGHPQPWEIVTSFVLMSLSIVAILYVASRIYRVGILMYGKKPSVGEMLRWLRYS
ncbi:ABC-2 type transport system permease protein [Granulicella rosea]|uniref:ABC-2 type transport system permease protein n=1 Tax=Granulicella rosea TaxID=474952 RepID=A0A239L6I0_9BACT|nr:ABC transporter permease [Granulicella rosea]SNT25900.1 ABC-2 type transport system permease protein [Granulicella rosea]